MRVFAINMSLGNRCGSPKQQTPHAAEIPGRPHFWIASDISISSGGCPKEASGAHAQYAGIKRLWLAR